MTYLDLHVHVLPGVDDGPATLEESLALLGELAAMGFDTVVATPHQRVGLFLPTAAKIAAAHAALVAAAGDLHVRVGLGVESYWDDLFAERMLGEGAPVLDGGRAFLFELPNDEIPPHLEDVVFRARLAGRLPALAHPERATALVEDAARVRALAARVALVVDLGALVGDHGRVRERSARALVAQGLAHAAATDAHAPADVVAARAGAEYLRREHGESALRRLLDENPRRILTGELPEGA
jgi:protein-tyrosine phosphatase